MEAIGDERAFFEEEWPRLRDALESGGPPSMVGAIMESGSDGERAALFRYARQGLVLGDWRGKNLDDYLTVAEAGIIWLGDRAEEVAAHERPHYLDVLAELTFNVAADVADCWPGDDEPRRPDQFRRAMEIAEQSVGLRDELRKPDDSKHLGWWAFGYHQLRLGHTDTACDSMERSLEHARRAARTTGQHDGIDARAPFPVLLSAGYLALARIADDEPSGPDLFAETLAALRTQLSDQSRQTDAQFAIDQLQRVRGLLA